MLNKSKIIWLSVLILSTLVCAFSGGDGSAANPYQISSREHLETVNSNLAASYILMNDIDLAGTTYTQAVIAPDTSTENYFQGTAFTGSFNGRGFKIRNLTISAAGKDYIGLFGSTDTNAVITNIGLTGGSISGRNYIGGLVGHNFASTTNCYSTGGVSGINEQSSYVGGLIGRNSGINTNCYSTGSVSCSSNRFAYVGGLMGCDEFGGNTNCYSTGSVNGGGYNTAYIGGFVGYSLSSNNTNCYATGNVSEIRHNSAYIGGFAGYNNSSNTNCYSTGSVSATVDYIGGFVGYDYGTNSNCFWDTETSGKTVGGGEGSIPGVTGRTTAQMKTQSTFTGWNFVDLWIMSNVSSAFAGYPVLMWQDTGYSGGDGSPVTPYQISTASDIMKLSRTPEHWDKLFSLTADINISEYPNITIGNFQKEFTGSFNGNFKTITGYRWTGESVIIGLFGIVGSEGRVFALNLAGVNITTPIPALTGTLVGQNFGVVAGCNVSGYMQVSQKGTAAGGIAGENNGSGKIVNCMFSGVIDSTTYGVYLGGIAGRSGGLIEDCRFTGSILGDDNGLSWSDTTDFYTLAGGIAGWNMSGNFNGSEYHGKIKFCSSPGAINIRVQKVYIGGIAGINSASIDRCEVQSPTNGIGSWEYMPTIGGIAGISQDGTISRCAVSSSIWANTSAVLGGIAGFNSTGGAIELCWCSSNIDAGSGNYVGGIAGKNVAAIANCYSLGSVNVRSGASNVYSGGVVGSNDGGSVTNTYSVGYVGIGTNSSVAGGVAGSNIYGTVTSSFWNTETSGRATSAGGTGKTTSQMLDSATFTAAGWNLGWSNTEVWTMNNWHPILTWEQNTKYSGGRGTAASPYLVSKAADWFEMANNPDNWANGVKFLMTANIDLVGYDFTPIGKWFNSEGQYDPTLAFNAYFDGGGYAMSGFSPSEVALNPVGFGLFGIAGENAVIKNLGVTAYFVHRYSQNCGMIVGACAGTVENCWTSGYLYVDRNYGRIGSIAGITTGIVRNCFSLADIGGLGNESHYGGVCGDNYQGLVENCYVADYSITAYGTDTYVGGIIGAQGGGRLRGCFYESANPGSPSVPAVGGQWGTVDGMTGAKSNTQMRSWNTFSSPGWDLSGTWTMSGWYPTLRVFNH